VAIIYATFKTLGIQQMTLSEGALREGVVHDLLGRIYNHDIRSKTVETLANDYHSDKSHGLRINKSACYMLQQLDPGRSQEDRKTVAQFLSWAAQLHEIGNDIAHSSYHKHSAYIIQYADLAGFSRQDQVLLSTLVRFHRKKFLDSAFKELPKPWNDYAPVLVIILRLAVILHRNRHTPTLPEFSLTLDKKQFKLEFPKHWLKKYPLTEADLQLEAEYLNNAGYKLNYH
jgi:exopolyphosphatase/guanosine-5'-triphosphate,3'-diphosphate pyrophosphatase